MSRLNVIDIARLCHSVNKAYCEAIGDNSQQPWDNSPGELRDSAIEGVIMHLKDNVTPAESHEAWRKYKEKNGWKYGPRKSFELKEHPNMVEYEQLPVEQMVKDYLYKAIVDFFRMEVFDEDNEAAHCGCKAEEEQGIEPDK